MQVTHCTEFLKNISRNMYKLVSVIGIAEKSDLNALPDGAVQDLLDVIKNEIVRINESIDKELDQLEQ